MAVGLTIELVVLVEDVKDGQNAKVSVHFVLWTLTTIRTVLQIWSNSCRKYVLDLPVPILASDDSIIRCQYLPVYDCWGWEPPPLRLTRDLTSEWYVMWITWLLVLLLLRAYAVWECQRIVLISSLVVYIVNLFHFIASTGLMHPKLQPCFVVVAYFNTKYLMSSEGGTLPIVIVSFDTE